MLMGDWTPTKAQQQQWDAEVYQAYADMARTEDGFYAFMDSFLNGDVLVAAE